MSISILSRRLPGITRGVWLRRFIVSSEVLYCPRCQFATVSDNSEKKHFQGKKELLGLGKKFTKMGGTRVVVAYFGLHYGCWLGFYLLFKNGLLSPDMIASFMNRYEFLSRYSALITENPNASLLTLAYLCNKIIGPLRMAIITAYGTYTVKQSKKGR
ncbi:hypothetical protein WA538_004823, partial [Blastocystis sp. DL]